jgi:hypothetical protein
MLFGYSFVVCLEPARIYQVTQEFVRHYCNGGFDDQFVGYVVINWRGQIGDQADIRVIVIANVLAWRIWFNNQHGGRPSEAELHIGPERDGFRCVTVSHPTAMSVPPVIAKVVRMIESAYGRAPSVKPNLSSSDDAAGEGTARTELTVLQAELTNQQDAGSSEPNTPSNALEPLSGTKLKVFTVFRDAARNGIRPGIAEVAETLGIDETTVSRHLRSLREKGFLEHTERSARANSFHSAVASMPGRTGAR